MSLVNLMLQIDLCIAGAIATVLGGLALIGHKRSPAKLMLLGGFGMAIMCAGILWLFKVLGFDPGAGFWVSMAAGMPLLVVWMWQCRSPDNTHFIPK